MQCKITNSIKLQHILYKKIVKLAIYIAKSDDDTAPTLKTQKYSLRCPFSHPRMNT